MSVPKAISKRRVRTNRHTKTWQQKLDRDHDRHMFHEWWHRCWRNRSFLSPRNRWVDGIDFKGEWVAIDAIYRSYKTEVGVGYSKSHFISIFRAVTMRWVADTRLMPCEIRNHRGRVVRTFTRVYYLITLP